MEFVVYSDRNDTRNVIEKVKFQWISGILQSLGIDWGESLDSDDPDNLSILQKAQIRKILDENKNLQIKDDHDGGLVIYVEKEPIAEWKKPYCKLHYNSSEIDRKKKYYVSIEISCWSVFDGEMEEK